MTISRKEFNEIIKEDIKEHNGEWFFDNDKIEEIWEIVQKRSSAITPENFKYIVHDVAEDIFILHSVEDIISEDEKEELLDFLNEKDNI